MPSYQKVQFVAFNIRPGTKAVTGKSHAEEYLGDEDHEKDIDFRCKLMKEAIEKAEQSQKSNSPSKPVAAAKGVGSSNAIKKDPDVLKVFMAPEFYFRGAHGGYPIEKVEKIMPTMEGETGKDKYKHWLFIYGTAIGYKQHDEETKDGADITDMDIILEVGDSGGNTTITLGPLTKSGDWKGAIVIERKEVQLVPKGKDYEPTGVSATVKTDAKKEIEIEIEKVDLISSKDVKKEGSAIITLKKDVDCKEMEKVDFCGDKNKTVPFRVTKSEKKVGKTVITVETPHPQKRFDNCPDCKGKCKKFKESSKNKDICECSHTHRINLKEFIKNGEKAKISRRILTLDGAHNFKAGNLTTLSKPTGKTEVFNIALVQKGGKSSAPSGGKATDPNREVIIYKEYVSSIDYVKTKGWKERKIYIHGQDHIRVLATDGAVMKEGSSDTGSKHYNEPSDTTHKDSISGKSYKISEKIKTGLGGGSVFTIDGITFGLEVCLDHAYGRLDKCYKTEKKGEKKPHIHLIPSWGMSIGGGPICCWEKGTVKGLVFNVDGNRSHSLHPYHATASVVRVNDGTYWCDSHLEETGKKGECCSKCRIKLEEDYGYCDTCHKDVKFANIKKDMKGTCGHDLRYIHKCSECNKYNCKSHPKKNELATNFCTKCKDNFPKSAGKDCPNCGAFQPLGKPIEGKDKDTITDKDIKKYFTNDGKIRIYGPVAIPK